MSKYGYLEVQRKAKARWEKWIIMVVFLLPFLILNGIHMTKESASVFIASLQIVAWVNFR
jgi:hypothetical protein